MVRCCGTIKGHGVPFQITQREPDRASEPRDHTEVDDLSRSQNPDSGAGWARLEELRTGDGCPLREHLKAQIGCERLELTLQQIKSVETERDAMLSPSDGGTPAPIRAFIDRPNQNPRPFKWTKSADQILVSVKCF